MKKDKQRLIYQIQIPVAVSILPKKTVRASQQSHKPKKKEKVKLRKPNAQPVLDYAPKEEPVQQSWHFSTDKSKSTNVPKASRMPSSSSACLSRSNRFASTVV